MSTQLRTFKHVNEFAEEWIFEYNPNSSISLLRESTNDSEKYPVIEGYAFDLFLPDDSKNWLKEVWREASKHQRTATLYRGQRTRLIKKEDSCALSDNFCPLCLEQKQNFENHHCIWSCEGGTDEQKNLLRLCCSCHAILTSGCIDESLPKDSAAYFHQIMVFGIDFFFQPGSSRRRHTGRSYFENSPESLQALNRFSLMSKENQRTQNQHVKTIGRLGYQYYRDIGSEHWAWYDHTNMQITAVPGEFHIDAYTVKN